MWRPFEKARAFVHTLELKSQKEWQAYSRGDMPEKGARPADIPSHPDRTYKDKGWINWPDWLGESATGTPRNIEWRPFEKARTFFHTLELKSQKEWQAYCRGDMPDKGKRPVDIPSSPDHVYLDWEKDKGWISWRDWLGTEWRPFEKARAFVHALELKSRREWKAYCRGDMPEKGTRPDNIPRAPDSTYKDKGWISWPDWLGTGKTSDKTD